MNDSALLQATVRQAQALSESELRFQQIAENVHEVFWMTTPPMGELLYVNPAYETIWGRSTQSLYERPRSFMDAIHPDDRQRAIPIIEGRREQGFEVEYRIVRPDGSVRWIRSRGFPVKDESGKVYRVAGLAEDVTDRKLAEEEARQAARSLQVLAEQREGAMQLAAFELQGLSRRLVELQESERRDLARELHDRVGQNLTALKFNLETFRPKSTAPGSEALNARVDDSAALLASTMEIIYNVMCELRPPMLDEIGLAAALDWHARNFSKRTGIAVAVRGSDTAAAQRAPQVEIALFRIAQEALNNVAKHAYARQVVIAIEHRNGEFTMSVQDDGIGLAEGGASKARHSLGMVTMRERSQAIGGRFEVQALPGAGTRLTVRVPT